MRLNLREITPEGKSFKWTRQTAELNDALSDLIAERPYFCEFTVRPLNNRDFELTGEIRTQAPELCSRCGIDIELPLRVKFREILIPRQELDRTGRYARVNHLSDAPEEGPATSEYDLDETFDMGEYVHEQVGLEIPTNPAPPENAAGDCEDCGQPVRGQSFGYTEEMPLEKPESPFAALKDLKLQ